jgi:hypothetical protein
VDYVNNYATNLAVVTTPAAGDYLLISQSNVLKKITYANTVPTVSTIALAKAWVNFDGTTNVGGNCTIRDDFNVSTVADNGTGDYTINFSTAMANANYAFATHGFDGTLDAYMNSWGVGPSFAQTTTSIRLQCTNDFVSTGYVTDLATACVTIFGS